LYARSEWVSCLSGSEAITLALKHGFVPPYDHFVLMLSIGIRYGAPVSGNQLQQIKYGGACKTLYGNENYHSYSFSSVLKSTLKTGFAVDLCRCFLAYSYPS
jgi:hypothetical protein